MTPPLQQTYAATIPELSLAWRAAPAPDPALVALDESVAATLGLDPAWLRSPKGVAFLVGDVPDDVPTFAQAYAGHQFGGYSPRLGDGRALLLGEVVGPDGTRRDLHLKGSGRTPFSRGGDGQAVLGPMLREHLVSAAMHALGISTTRALAVTTTGTRVFRDGRMLPGAVLARVASSHLRVGTFQYAAANGGPDLVRRLADVAIERHYPDSAGLAGAARYLAFYEAVCARQADLVAAWLSVGFVHGVMNTDNVSIAGETIDYGPCAFLDAYDPDACFSSIDAGGRYAYGQQPAITQWNLARLGETLLPLLADDANEAVEAATGVLTGFAQRYDTAATARMAGKLGLAAPGDDDRDRVRGLVADLLALLRDDRVDFTGFFRALAAGTARELAADAGRFDAWEARWEALLPEGRGSAAAAMDRVNPVTIPRNHRVDKALEAAQAGDLAPFTRLLDAVTHPYEQRAEWADLSTPAPPDAGPFVTYCGT